MHKSWENSDTEATSLVWLILCLAPGFDCWTRNDTCCEMICEITAAGALAYVICPHTWS